MNCHYCNQELSANNICENKGCSVQSIVNLYFKDWFLSVEEIKERLTQLSVSWVWGVGRFFISVTPEDHHEVRGQLAELMKENGSNLNDSVFDDHFNLTHKWKVISCECEGEGCVLCKNRGEIEVLHFSEKKSIHFQSMKNKCEYVTESGTDCSNFLTIFMRDNDKLMTTYVGGEFEDPQSFWFKLDVIDKLDLFKDDPIDLSVVTLDSLDGISSEVYNEVMQLEVSEEFDDLMGILE
ncbi:hypothetical protein ABE82_26410 (plasmid) [Paenibacillus peoriae]|uniref:hypothetical protein n=1 Tax=Paenibacillus peoriae TaxID=59893 RepID=UPI000721005B|nr:hypothetical protein [Paenibacillus peoriae]ALS09950.1 hypothetical protein ABE82_26410 [Paenibacillus peoriae]